MEEPISETGYCGLGCFSCPIYLAAREPDPDCRNRMRVDIARICNAEYGTCLTPEDITGCDGCKTRDGILFSSCAQCSIRGCAVERGFDTCAECEGFACGDLERLFSTDRSAKIRLETIRARRET